MSYYQPPSTHGLGLVVGVHGHGNRIGKITSIAWKPRLWGDPWEYHVRWYDDKGDLVFCPQEELRGLYPHSCPLCGLYLRARKIFSLPAPDVQHFLESGRIKY